MMHGPEKSDSSILFKLFNGVYSLSITLRNYISFNLLTVLNFSVGPYLSAVRRPVALVPSFPGDDQ